MLNPNVIVRKIWFRRRFGTKNVTAAVGKSIIMYTTIIIPLTREFHLN